jgi:betaine lipid synthase
MGPGLLSLGFGFHNMSSPYISITIAALAVCVLVVSVLLISFRSGKINHNNAFFTLAKFIYASFLKPHETDQNGDGGQQHALESFYKTQVGRRVLRPAQSRRS